MRASPRSGSRSGGTSPGCRDGSPSPCASRRFPRPGTRTPPRSDRSLRPRSPTAGCRADPQTRSGRSRRLRVPAREASAWGRPPLGRIRAAIIEAAHRFAIPPDRAGQASCDARVMPSGAMVMLGVPKTKARPLMLDSDPIAPHGGTLVDLLVAEAERDRAREEARNLPKLTVNERELSDLEMLAVGALSPLTGFLGEKDYRSILDSM